MQDTQDEPKATIESSILKALTTTFKEAGLTGFIAIFLVSVFFMYASAEQKSEFIDRFLLFKNVQNDPLPFTFVVICLFAILMGTNFYNYKERNRLNKEIDRISNEKTSLHNKMLEKLLESSK